MDNPKETKNACLLAVPCTDSIVPENVLGLAYASKKMPVHLAIGRMSLLTMNFNRLWAEALNSRESLGITYFAMCHSDISTVTGWIDTMIEEMDKHGADIISAVVPIKDSRGLTTTAVGFENGNIRRLTLTEAHEYPETFNSSVLQEKYPGGRLLLNTGLWVCKFTDPWVEENCFRVIDQIRRNKNTGLWEAVALSEDWDFSNFAHARGLKTVATRKVPVQHWGVACYESDMPAGTQTTDLNFGQYETGRDIICQPPKPLPKLVAA